MPERVKHDSADAIEQRLVQHKAEVQRLIEDGKTADTREKAELHDRIKVLEDKIEADKKAKEEAEKAEGTGGTLVLPPEQVEQGQHHGDKPGDKAAGQQEATHHGDKPRGLKRWW